MDHVEKAFKYIDGVLAGEIPAGKWIKLACQRQLDDLERAELPYMFHVERANHVCKFIELLPHIKGKWAGKPIVLEPWQCFILTTAFGWVDDEGLRRFRTAYTEVPRKNAKSTISSGVGLYCLAADDEAGAEVYSAATTRDQAKIVFNDAKRMAQKCPGLRDRFGVATSAHSVYVEDSASYFQALSAEGNSLDGLNIHTAVVDELHAHKTRAVFDVIETATGSRTQSMLWLITTAGSNRAGICYEQRTYLTKILDGVVEDDSYFGVIYTTDEGDDWAEPETWMKANPNYGVSVFPDDIARLCKKALEMPSAQNNFLTKRLNVWVNADSAWMDMRRWEACGDPELDPADFENERCVVGLDLASKVDIAAKVRVFDRGGEYYVFGDYYLPEDTVAQADNSQYQGWSIEGLLTETPGAVIDQDRIKDDLIEDAGRFELGEVGFDPFNATKLSSELIAEGFQMVEIRPTVLNFSEPMKWLEALVLEGKIHHNGCPILTWMVSNVVCHLDAKDNIYPRKERPENKIDGVVALLMAMNRLLTPDDSGNLDDFLNSVVAEK